MPVLASWQPWLGQPCIFVSFKNYLRILFMGVFEIVDWHKGQL